MIGSTKSCKCYHLKRAETTLSTAVYDGKSKNWTWTKHTNRLQESFQDMAASGQHLEERTKVNKLLASFQFEPLKHLSTTVETNAAYHDNFERAVSLISGQMANLRIKNGANNRNIGAVETMDGIEYEDAPDEKPRARPSTAKLEVKKAKVQLKQLKAQIKKGKKKLLAYKKGQTTKFDRKNPGAYISASEWKKLTKEQQAEARAARQAAGIPTRSVGALFTARATASVTTRSMATTEGTRNVPPGLLKAPPKSSLLATQREALYSNRRAKRVVFVDGDEEDIKVAALTT